MSAEVLGTLLSARTERWGLAEESSLLLFSTGGSEVTQFVCIDSFWNDIVSLYGNSEDVSGVDIYAAAIPPPGAKLAIVDILLSRSNTRKSPRLR
jgi:hypothetical protein